jgi:4-amino-4-deoxy-L-arabinose transferase-like glycosyltransferase
MNRHQLTLSVALAIIYIRGLFIPVMDVDASQYASISMEMLQNGSWLQVMHRHADYLDKPPLLFWLSAASYALFGIQTWAYKLPSLLGALAGIYATYRFARLFYNTETARAAGLVLASSLGLILMCNDVRTDTLLLGMSAMAVWQIAAHLETRQWKYLFGAGIFTGLAMLAKGPIGAILPAAAVGAHLLLQRDWRAIFRWQWLVMLAVTGLVLVPMCIGLYQQFDVRPEKIINGRTGVSGLYFFFWEQSFGRITGENVWKNDTTVLYFTHVFAWAVIPWTLLFVAGLASRLRTVWLSRFRLPKEEEGYSIGVFVLIFIALSLSKYKLPHYIFVLLPWAAVLTARFLFMEKKETVRWLRIAHYMVLALVAGVAFSMPGFMFPTLNPLIWIPAATIFGYAILETRPQLPGNTRFFQGTAAFGILVGFILNFHFYPHILAYQSTSEAGKYFRQKGIPPHQLAVMGFGGHALDFYSQTLIPFVPTAEDAVEQSRREGGLWVYAREGGREQLDAAGVKYQVDTIFGHFQAALLKMKFLNPATREEALMPVTILKIE